MGRCEPWRALADGELPLEGPFRVTTIAGAYIEVDAFDEALELQAAYHTWGSKILVLAHP